MEINPALFFVLLSLTVLGLVIAIWRSTITRLQSDVEALRKEVKSELTNVTGDVRQSLTTMTEQIKIFGEVQSSLGELTKATQQVHEVGKDIAGLQNIFKAPGPRGGFGEILLANLLAQILPVDRYTLQHSFRDGTRVDAAIHLAGGIVPVDSKFSLDNFRRIVECTTDDERNKAHRSFARSVRKRVDETARYIRPDEGTFDFAIMYIPAENVCYEILTMADLFEYALGKRVIPASPNSFYAYLNVIALGLRGLRIEEHTRAILDQLCRLQGDFDTIQKDFATLGSHLDKAGKKYVEVQRHMDRFTDRLGEVATGGELPGDTSTPALPES